MSQRAKGVSATDGTWPEMVLQVTPSGILHEAMPRGAAEFPHRSQTKRPLQRSPYTAVGPVQRSFLHRSSRSQEQTKTATIKTEERKTRRRGLEDLNEDQCESSSDVYAKRERLRSSRES